MGSSKWRLESTLDRRFAFASNPDRQASLGRLLQAFKREAIRGGLVTAEFPRDKGLELLARHHGLPSPMLDFTESPFIAAYFAFAGVGRVVPGEMVSIWTLNRTMLPDDEAVELIDDIELLRVNRRALSQRGVFLRLGVAAPLEELVAPALFRFDFPVEDAVVALAELEGMCISATTLMCDLDGAAATVSTRLGLTEKNP